MNSLVSVIVPVYNKEDVLSRCLNSIKNQSYTYFEVLLVNDGSKDKSLPILKCKKCWIRLCQGGIYLFCGSR